MFCYHPLHRRSGASGFCLPLSGGADSSSTAAIVGVMCQMVSRAVAAGDGGVVADVLRYDRRMVVVVVLGTCWYTYVHLHDLYMCTCMIGTCAPIP